MPRGTINHRERAKQINDFSELKYGTITPTDLDGLIEYHDKAYIIIETKYIDAKLPPGQRLALERLTDDLSKTGKDTICIVASHEIHDPKKDVNVARTQAIEYRRNNKWTTCNCTTKEVIDNFLKNLEKNKFNDTWKRILGK